MTDSQIADWIAGVELDLANVASEDDAYGVRWRARQLVFESRGLETPPWPKPDDPPGQIPMIAR